MSNEIENKANSPKKEDLENIVAPEGDKPSEKPVLKKIDTADTNNNHDLEILVGFDEIDRLKRYRQVQESDSKTGSDITQNTIPGASLPPTPLKGESGGTGNRPKALGMAIELGDQISYTRQGKEESK